MVFNPDKWERGLWGTNQGRACTINSGALWCASPKIHESGNRGSSGSKAGLEAMYLH